MYIYMVFLVILFLASGFAGYRQLLRLEHLNKSRIANSMLIAAILLTLLSFANLSGIFPEAVAAKITMALYTIAGGFFVGYGFKMISLRKKSGDIEYMYRSFWTDIAPNIIAVILFVYGIYRTGVLEWEYFTGIGITSGLSLIGFSFWGWTVHIVPEFRSKGMLVLDKSIPWEKVVTYEWNTEEILRIEYLNTHKKLTEFKTFVPAEDQLIIERILGRKINEHEEERQKVILSDDES